MKRLIVMVVILLIGNQVMEPLPFASQASASMIQSMLTAYAIIQAGHLVYDIIKFVVGKISMRPGYGHWIRKM